MNPQNVSVAAWSARATRLSSGSGFCAACAADPKGDLVTHTSSSTTWYAFDIDNRLVKAIASGKTYASAHGGLGDRVQGTGPQGSKTYTNTVVASGDQMLYLKNVVGSTTSKTVYLYAGSLLIATVGGSTYSYFHEDALGDTRLVTQTSHGGKVTTVFSTNYEPFGVLYGASDSDPSVKYTGQWDEPVPADHKGDAGATATCASQLSI